MPNDSLDQSIENLKQLGPHTTKGRWWVDSHGTELVSFPSDSGIKTVVPFGRSRDKAHRDEFTGNLSYWNNDSDASWIVTAQPEVVLGIIARMELAEAKLAAIQAMEETPANEYHRDADWGSQCIKNAEIRGTNQRLTEIKGMI